MVLGQEKTLEAHHHVFEFLVYSAIGTTWLAGKKERNIKRDNKWNVKINE